MEERPWADLQFDLLSIISNQLGLIDLLSFRAVCNHWRSASSQASAEIESSKAQLWFLLYGETAQCCFLTYAGRYRIEIPEMFESTCLASFVGWLLLYRKNSNSLFFFCPFSRAKIEIPPCPLILEQSQSESDLYAAFSYYPTDPDCTLVVVIKRKNDAKMKLCMLHRGEYEWTFHEHIASDQFVGQISSVAFQERAFHFWDEYSERVVVFQYDTMTWVNYFVIHGEQQEIAASITLDYRVKAEANEEIFSSKRVEMKQLLGIDHHDLCSISICGATSDAKHHGTSHEFLEEEEDIANKPRREFKGVWLQPRFYQISEDQQRW
ncbi:hypothetical protein QN277_005953 [Acacia crassicarpa]|nr:hypothetical protein QN277_005953 [Acacia crassicarpa]